MSREILGTSVWLIRRERRLLRTRSVVSIEDVGYGSVCELMKQQFPRDGSVELDGINTRGERCVYRGVIDILVEEGVYRSQVGVGRIVSSN